MKTKKTIANIFAIALLGILAVWASMPQHFCLCSQPESNMVCEQEHKACCAQELINQSGIKADSCCCSDIRTAFLQSLGLRPSKQSASLKSAAIDWAQGSLLGLADKRLLTISWTNQLKAQNDFLKANKLYLLHRELLI